MIARLAGAPRNDAINGSSRLADNAIQSTHRDPRYRECSPTENSYAMEKRFALSADQIVPLIPAMGYCYATDRITVDAAGVGFMYREVPEKPNDSGWRFFSGDESQEYADDAANTMLYDVNTIANYDRDIVPYLETDPPCAFERMQNGGYIAVDTDFMDEDRQG